LGDLKMDGFCVLSRGHARPRFPDAVLVGAVLVEEWVDVGVVLVEEAACWYT
jgi:hypothetical protein